VVEIAVVALIRAEARPRLPGRPTHGRMPNHVSWHRREVLRGPCSGFRFVNWTGSKRLTAVARDRSARPRLGRETSRNDRRWWEAMGSVFHGEPAQWRCGWSQIHPPEFMRYYDI
jgi:hypothetical protein